MKFIIILIIILITLGTINALLKNKIKKEETSEMKTKEYYLYNINKNINIIKNILLIPTIITIIVTILGILIATNIINIKTNQKFRLIQISGS